MSWIDKHNCILCEYNKYNKNGDSCFNHFEKDELGYSNHECNSLSNIYYGKLLKKFPFKQIDDFRTERWVKEHNRWYEEMVKKYGDPSMENDHLKFIWGDQVVGRSNRYGC